MPRPELGGELARTVTQEADESWPTMIEVVAWFGHHGRKGKRRSVEISADRFFGTGRYGAPMSGAELIGVVERLRHQGHKIEQKK